ncbi:MAG: hypothetical protein K2I92_07265 [Muribaculaceae bacterium]|nr:hypothetical protein [Muribaculaceae bacterium]
MKKISFYTLLATVCIILPSCLDHDDPKLSPIDTTKVRITATVKDYPDTQWLNIAEELTLNVSDIEMTAPKGVVLRSVSLTANNGTGTYIVDDKPYSGEPLEFKVPLRMLKGRVNFSLRGNLIKKDSRDAEVIIADNIQKLIFSEEPKFECEGWLSVSVKGKSTTGEEYSHSFEIKSDNNLTIPIAQNELYWTPTSGTASTIEVSLGSGANAWSPNTTFDCKILKTAVGHSSGDEPTIRMTIPNTPGSLNSQKLQLYVLTSYFGIWEDICIQPYNLTNVLDLVETE